MELYGGDAVPLQHNIPSDPAFRPPLSNASVKMQVLFCLSRKLTRGQSWHLNTTWRFFKYKVTRVAATNCYVSPCLCITQLHASVASTLLCAPSANSAAVASSSLMPAKK